MHEPKFVTVDARNQTELTARAMRETHIHNGLICAAPCDSPRGVRYGDQLAFPWPDAVTALAELDDDSLEVRRITVHSTDLLWVEVDQENVQPAYRQEQLQATSRALRASLGHLIGEGQLLVTSKGQLDISAISVIDLLARVREDRHEHR